MLKAHTQFYYIGKSILAVFDCLYRYSQILKWHFTFVGLGIFLISLMWFFLLVLF
jgi:hypothetical protein